MLGHREGPTPNASLNRTRYGRRLKHHVGKGGLLMNYAVMSDRAITRGFVLAGAVNVFGMLVVSKAR